MVLPETRGMNPGAKNKGKRKMKPFEIGVGNELNIAAKINAWRVECERVRALGRPTVLQRRGLTDEFHPYGRKVRFTAILLFSDGARGRRILSDIGRSRIAAIANAERALDSAYFSHPGVIALSAFTVSPSVTAAWRRHQAQLSFHPITSPGREAREAALIQRLAGQDEPWVRRHLRANLRHCQLLTDAAAAAAYAFAKTQYGQPV